MNQLTIKRVKVDYLPKSKKELAAEYGCSVSTIYRNCKRFGIDTDGRMLSVTQVKEFYAHYGEPCREVFV